MGKLTRKFDTMSRRWLPLILFLSLVLLDAAPARAQGDLATPAISAATRDYRFHPVTADELESLDVKVDVLSDPEPVQSLDELDPRQYGLIVQSKSDPRRRKIPGEYRSSIRSASRG